MITEHTTTRLHYTGLKRLTRNFCFQKVMFYSVYRSGDEGIYPHLIKFCESHLETLDPRSRALRKDNPVATAASLSKDEWSQIFDGLKVCCTLLCNFSCLLI